MITLISRWKLRDGCSDALWKELQAVAAKVQAAEPGTLVYSVHLAAAPPLTAENEPKRPQPEAIPHDQQTEVVFFEVYADAQAFADHVNGPTFAEFLDTNRKHFYADPADPCAPNADTTFYERASAFFRPGC